MTSNCKIAQDNCVSCNQLLFWKYCAYSYSGEEYENEWKRNCIWKTDQFMFCGGVRTTADFSLTFLHYKALVVQGCFSPKNVNSV